MEAWNYGYIYLCRTIYLTEEEHVDIHDNGPTMAVIRTGEGIRASQYVDPLPIMDALGAEGWAIGERMHFETGAPPMSVEALKSFGLQGWGYTSYFLRRRIE